MTADPGLELHITVPVPDVRVVRVAGELDLLTSPKLANCLTGELARHPTHLIVDLTDVRYLGSTGLQVLVEARAAAEVGHCRLWLTGATTAVVRRPLEWAGLLSLFTCYDTVDLALAELG